MPEKLDRKLQGVPANVTLAADEGPRSDVVTDDVSDSDDAAIGKGRSLETGATTNQNIPHSSSASSRKSQLKAVAADVTKEFNNKQFPDSKSQSKQPQKSTVSKTATKGESSTTPGQPVLVRTYDGKMNVLRPSARQTRLPGDRIRNLPPPSAFSFQEILAAIDPEIRASIDSIAEICGRSKLSLSNEYGAHRPPQGELNRPGGGESNEAVQNMLHHYLEPVEETASTSSQPVSSSAAARGSTDGSVPDMPDSPRTAARSHSRALLGMTPRNAPSVTSSPITETYNVTSHPRLSRRQRSTSRSGEIPLPTQSSEISEDKKPERFPNLLSWFQQFENSTQPLPGSSSSRHTEATRALKGVLKY